MGQLIRITEQPIDLQELLETVSNERNGGIVLFTGTVRRWNEGNEVHWLEYETYKEAAEITMAEIARKVEKQWGISDIAMSHRIGQLGIKDIAVGVAIGSPHRAEAFAACQFVIDTLKATVPIWKKESWEGDEQSGQRWVENKV
ncbi:MAG: molybdenum cofactor biosynthesis protein MoaE [Chloroflexi bacterium]|uniref:Molybdenum cofactor biosynthesis protein MoaE n=1 Tax=Candidatus Chlorohelix allophototropha TaxID=3003348 RepID=A0A8T7M3B1_9CHLR|nr:molybdenum cofactor biosynthesis protein MoaE [Chloroflexota bacterium]WJW67515.1 molybdenum cofactor biosynthesis protein MoaE [Chloroflexota bacterium L227-S17]